MKELKQQYLNERREFYLEPSRMRVYVKDFDGDSEAFIDYESITSKTRRVTLQSGRLYIIAVSTGIFATVGFVLNLAGVSSLMRWVPVWAVASAILFAFHFYKRRRYFLVDLNNDRSLFFLTDRPSKEALEEFIRAMYEAQKRYFREKYFTTKRDNDPEDELKRYQWLLDEGVISEDEFEQMKQTIDSNSSSLDVNTAKGKLPN